MLRINSFLAVLSFSALQLAGQPQFELSRNVYRVPYSNGITVMTITHMIRWEGMT